MKTLTRIGAIALLGIMFAAVAYGDTSETTMKFPSPGSPGTLNIISGSGDITINGYNGSEVIIIADSEGDLGVPDETDERARGLTRITGNTFSIDTGDEGNTITINRSMQDETDLVIRVPRETSVSIGGGGRNRYISADNIMLMNEQVARAANYEQAQARLRQEQAAASRDRELAEQERQNLEEQARRQSTGTTVVVPSPQTITIPIMSSLRNVFGGGVLEGDITITDITGDVEVNAIEGDIIITGVTGSVIASTVDGDIEVELLRHSGDTPLSFSSVDGDVDVTVPASLKANVQLRSTDGVIYTDFDIAMSSVTPNERNADLFMVGGGVGQSVNGTVNGGGRDVSITTVDGNIYFSSKPPRDRK